VLIEYHVPHIWLNIPNIASWLVVLTILKNHGLRQWVSDDIPYMKWKIKFMFQTTNQPVNAS